MPKNKISGRDKRLDAIRGLLLLVMTIDHFPSIFSTFTNESMGYITAAEGFVFLSGLVAGKIYSRYRRTERLGTLLKRAVMRACFIYTAHIIVLITLIALAVFGLKTWYFTVWSPRLYEDPVQSLLMGLTLTYQPHLLDILPMYCGFIMAVPFVVQPPRRFPAIVLVLISGAVWLFSQFRVAEPTLLLSKYLPVDFGFYNPLSWQFIFVLGTFVGIEKEAPSFHGWAGKFVLIFCAAIALMLFAVKHGFITQDSLVFRIESLAQKDVLGPVRLINFCVIAFLVSRAFVWMTNNKLVSALALLGRHSIEVFSFHIFLVYFFYGSVQSSTFKELWVVLLVGSLFVPACFFEKHRNPCKTWFSPRIKAVLSS